jgi:hypothetical protein
MKLISFAANGIYNNPIRRKEMQKTGKQILLLTVFLLSCYKPMTVEASEDTVPFILNVIQSLYDLHWASEVKPEDEETSSIISHFLTQNRRYKMAQTSIENHLSDKDNTRQVISKGIFTGAKILIDANNNLLAHLKKIGTDPEEALKENDFIIGQAKADKKQGWEMVSIAAPFIMYEIMEPAQSDHPEGPIPFLISKQERQILLARIEELFGESLEKYYAYRNGEGNAKNQTYVVFSIDAIKSYLISETYEDYAKIRPHNKFNKTISDNKQ